MSEVIHNSRPIVEIVKLLLAIVYTTIFAETIGFADDAVWQPGQTRVFLVSLTRFKSERLHSFTSDDRLDDRFAQLFRDRGVPASQVVLLKDEAATNQNVEREFTSLLRTSGPSETLIFYFGSHGGYDHKTGEYSFCAFNDNVSFAWVLDAIERDFKGSRAILLTDCCYSGGIVELATKRKSSISYACLSSTYAHQTAWSGWRFVQCMLRGLAGHPVVDLDGNGHVDLTELASYTAHYMAFAAEGKPAFQVTGHFNPKLQLATTNGTKAARVGELLEVHSNNTWEKAEVIDVQERKLKIHFTKDTRTVNDAWFAIDHVRPFQFERYPNGSVVEVRDSSGANWHTAKVIEAWESLHHCRRDGYPANYDEWFGPRRIRNSMAGNWTGRWKNNLNESGPETLELVEGKDEKLSGTWSGDVTLKGERIGNDIIYFEGTKPGRFYRCAGRIEGAQLILNYVAHRTDADGHYFGIARLGRQGEVGDAVRDQRSEFAGQWVGTYENSRGGSGKETCTISENADKIHAVWSGVEVSGERLGDTTFFLEGKSGDRHYHVIGHTISGRLVLDYYATAGNDHYTGRSMLNR